MLWIKSFHIIFVASWFAGLFYLPRIYVNLAMLNLEQESEQAVCARLLLMARKLYRFMTILAVPAIVLGLWLWLAYGYQGGWLHSKIVLVLLALAYHFYCGVLLRRFEHAANVTGASPPATSHPSHIWLRWFNEIPVLLLSAIVILAVVKPF